MRLPVLSQSRRRMFGSVAAISMAGLIAGCSGDVVRFDDGFYTGAVPQSPVPQAGSAQPYPGGLDRTTTSAIAPAGPGGGYVGSQPSGYPASGGNMQRGQLPPPPEPSYRSSQPNYGSSQPDYRGQVNSNRSEPARSTYDTRPAPRDMSRSDTDTNRGAPPTSLQAQAGNLATPRPRPMNEGRNAAPERRAANRSAASSVTVSSGDTLNGIAHRTGVPAETIRQANNMSSDTVRLGQKLLIPAGGRMPASKPREVASAVKTPIAQPEAPKVTANPAPSRAVNDRKSGRIASAPAAVDSTPTGSVTKQVEQQVATVAPNSTGIDQFRWPVQGRVVNRYGEKVDGRRNDGVNISVPRGTAIKAAENGVVIYAGDGLKEFGNTVLVKHDNGLVTVYGHADTLAVKKGETVRRGEVIAQSGMSGDTDVPVLHFEVRKNSTPVDPMKFLQ